ncbi:MAG: helix-turn-helix domain-containing protein [Clostridia bacterium]|nr:helix-turn-helix domain-containing protein [Clostridia bacterium]MDE6676810.1 helix-turn-helix domain-containing protein [Clostridia bacterium]
MIIANKIKELRIENHLSQTELAKKVGCNQSMVARWEKGECEPTATAILKLSIALNCSADYLLGKTEI